MSRRTDSPAHERSLSTHRSPSAGVRPLLGWREWVGLPDLELAFVEAKIDTGARSSSMDADPIEEIVRGRQRWLRFAVYSSIDLSMAGQVVEAELLAYRDIRSSNGQSSHRPVVKTTIQVGAHRWPIELTLTNRRAMGFRLLLGRSAIADRFQIDASQSYLAGRRPR